jgi:glutamine synthetase
MTCTPNLLRFVVETPPQHITDAMTSESGIRAEPLAFVGTSDLAGHFRGKGFVLAELENRLRFGVGLSPSNIMLSAFGPIHETPFGTLGELALKPDPQTHVRLQLDSEACPPTLFLGDIMTLAGEHWACCPRDFLRRGLTALMQVAGVRIHAAFEQEFVYTGADPPGLSYSFNAFRRAGDFGARLLGALRATGITPETFLAEYALRQYEVTTAPATGLRAADEAVLTREFIRAAAEHCGHRATLAPVLEPNGVGNGTHVHLSLLDSGGYLALYDPDARYELSGIGRSFVAGLVQHMPAYCALTAPSVASYYRLRPGKWAPTAADMGLLDRGAAIRICGGYAKEPELRARQLNIEFRVADAAASPYLVLGALVHAGVDGIRRRLDLPRTPTREPLPHDLAQALELLEHSEAVRGWLGEALSDAYLRLKRAEIHSLEGLTEEQICQRYAEVY